MNSSSRRTNVMFLLMGALSVGLVFLVLAIAGVFEKEDPVQQPVSQAAPATTAAAPSAAPSSVSDIYRRVSPGVVFVAASGVRTEQAPLDVPPGEENQPQASGSGFLIDRDGYIVTNDHVVDGADNVTVRFGEEGEPIDARVVGTDPSSDIALLKVDPGKIEGGPKPLELGSSRSLQPGAAAIAIGSPFGLEGTVTSGIISAMGREIQAPNGFSISGVVQTDAAINPGNSGGPLLDGNGRVIGVNSQIASNSGSNSGVGFAVPIDTVKQVVPELKRDGKVERAWLGVSTSETTQRDGATVQTVTPSGPADDADLRRGDKIVEVGGKPIRTPEDLSTAVGDRKPGDKVDVVVERDGDRETLNVTLGTRPNQPPQS
jgi:S1-C subfamily serine protease